MEAIVQRCCGLDVHQRSITACIMRQGYPRQVRPFETTTRALLTLKDWLIQEHITHLAMESTGGVYWKPVFNVLDGHFTLLLVNARHIKHVPGRKTDVMDAELLTQFRKIEQLPSDQKMIIKELLDAFLLKNDIRGRFVAA